MTKPAEFRLTRQSSKAGCQPEPQRLQTLEAQSQPPSNILSTPHSRGTASDSEYKTDGGYAFVASSPTSCADLLILRSRRIANIGLIEEDLASTEIVPFVAMMKSLVQRSLELVQDTEIDTLAISEAQRKAMKLRIREDSEASAKKVVVALLSEATKFCNGRSYASKILKRNIVDMCVNTVPSIRGPPPSTNMVSSAGWEKIRSVLAITPRERCQLRS